MRFSPLFIYLLTTQSYVIIFKVLYAEFTYDFIFNEIQRFIPAKSNLLFPCNSLHFRMFSGIKLVTTLHFQSYAWSLEKRAFSESWLLVLTSLRQQQIQGTLQGLGRSEVVSGLSQGLCHSSDLIYSPFKGQAAISFWRLSSFTTFHSVLGERFLSVLHLGVFRCFFFGFERVSVLLLYRI